MSADGLRARKSLKYWKGQGANARGGQKNTFRKRHANVLTGLMRTELERAVLTVLRHAGGWAVKYDGEHFGHSPDKEVAKAFAHKRAREIVTAGRGAQVLVHGENGFFGG